MNKDKRFLSQGKKKLLTCEFCQHFIMKNSLGTAFIKKEQEVFVINIMMKYINKNILCVLTEKKTMLIFIQLKIDLTFRLIYKASTKTDFE